MITPTPGVMAQIEAGNPPVLLLRIDFAGVAPVLLTDAAFDIEWGGEDWLSTELMLSNPATERVSEIRTRSGDIVFTAVDLTIPAIPLNNNQVGRKVTLYEAWVDGNGDVVPDPYVRDIYYVNDMSIEQGTSTATVGITLSGEWADFEIVKGIRTTDASLQRITPGDRLFQYSKDVNKSIPWGGK